MIVAPPRIDALRDTLGDDCERVMFADMGPIGENPGRIIPAWHEFVDAVARAAPQSGVRGGHRAPAAVPVLHRARAVGARRARHAHPFACDHDGPLAGDECDHVWARPAPPPAEPAHVDLVFRGTTVRFHVSLD